MLPEGPGTPPRGWLDPQARRIFLQLHSHGAGDVVNLVPLVQELAARHPSATLFVVTNHDTIPFDRCAANVRVIARLPDDEPGEAACHLDLEPWVRYHLLCPHWLQYFVIAGIGSCTLRDDPFPLLGGGVPARLEAALTAGPYVLLHARNSRGQWHGRNTDAANIRHLVRRMHDAGLRVFEIGNDAAPEGDVPRLGPLSTTELCQAMRGARGFIGIDSFPLHVAALYDKPTLAFFGATYPSVVLTPVTRLLTLRNEALGCDGCVYVTRPVGYNQCHFGDQRCGEPLPAAYLDQQADHLLALIKDPDARVETVPRAQLEYQLRSAQLVYEEAMLIQALRRHRPMERLRERLQASGSLRRLGNLMASLRAHLGGKRS
jgi:hypothetical protein